MSTADEKTQAAISMVASRALRKVVEAATEDPERLREGFPEVDPEDFAEVVGEMRRIASVLDVIDATFEAGYEHLSARADAR